MSWSSFKYKKATIRAVVIVGFMAVAFFLGRSLGESVAVEPAEASVPTPPAVIIENNNNYYTFERPAAPHIVPDVFPEVSHTLRGPSIIDERVK